MSAPKDRLPATLATARLVLAAPTLAQAPSNAGKPAIFMRLDFEP